MPRARWSRRRVKKHCDRVGITMSGLARETRLSLDTIRKIDSGRRDPLLTTALSLAHALAIEVEEIFGEP